MRDDLPDLPSLRLIEPPPNGLAGLRAALERDDDRRRSRLRWVLAVVPAAAIVLVVLLRRDREVIVLPSPEPVAEAAPDLSIAPTFYSVSSTPGRPPEPQLPGVSYVEVERTTAISQLPLR